ncbi:MAG: hypothetical protein OXE99_06090 [Cellvibrionales bacterium]|nr:hypothetical protein [Cellvibrionales bacterium]
MSNRSMLEINHDHVLRNDEELLKWAKSMQHYLSSGDPKLLPKGVTWFGMRHHSSECPLGKPPRGWHNQG